MKRFGVIALAIVGVVVVVFYIIRIIDSTHDNNQREMEATSEAFDGIIAEVTTGEICEVLVDLGQVPYSCTTTTLIRVVNGTNEPLVLLNNTTQCRCMWLEFDREPIAVGGTTDVTLYFDSRGEWGSIGNYMEITTSQESLPIVLWIGAEIE